MKLLWKCYCINAEAELEVSDRRQDEDLLHWMDDVIKPALTREHRRVNSLCLSQTMEYVKLPLDEAAPGIGQKPQIN
jgi:hypothetical protein